MTDNGLGKNGDSNFGKGTRKKIPNFSYDLNWVKYVLTTLEDWKKS